MSNVINFPSRDKLGFSPNVSKEVLTKSMQSYQSGRSAYQAGKSRRKPSYKSDCFDFNAWLIGWDDAERDDRTAA